MPLQRRPLSLAIHLLLATTLASSALAQSSTDANKEAAVLDVVEVSALAISEDPDQIATPYSIVERDRLQARAPSTLGEAINGLPGVHADTFGGGASRPVIRGQTAPRVRVLSDGASVLDASDISPDHAVTVDPLLGQRIEVLRGPATLLYGSGAVGGVVNVLDDKVPTAMPADGVDGSLVLRGNTVADERAGAAQFTFGIGSNLAVHAEGSIRDADDYRVPDFEESRVDGTFAESRNASAGISWIGERGYVGIAYSHREDEYGLPGHSHEYHDCHPHGSSLHCGGHDDDDHGDGHEDEHDDEHEPEEPPFIDLLSKRIDVRGEFIDPFTGFDRLRFRIADTDYRHHEIELGHEEHEHEDGEEEEHEGEEEIATTFRNDGYEARFELQHSPWGRWTGVFGLQHSDTRFGAEGEEAFVPTVDTRNTGLFLVEHIEASDAWHLELGARHEWLEHTVIDDPRNRPDFDDTATSLSGAAVWQFAPSTTLTFSLAHSERLPHAQELYARGLHLATNTFECGLLPSALTCGGSADDRAIETETSRNIELGLRRTAGALSFELSAFANDADNYIYARTLDQFEDFRLIKYTQADAEFRGIEAELSWAFSDDFSASVFGDRVRAEFADGSGNLPRISPSRLGTRLNGNWGAFSAEFEYYHVGRQDRIADFETRTPGYGMLNLSLGYRFGTRQQTHVFLRASNLLNEQVWNHTSFLASVVPLPGRNLSAGVRVDF